MASKIGGGSSSRAARRCSAAGLLLALSVFAAPVPVFAAETTEAHGTIAAIDIPQRTITIAPDLPQSSGNTIVRVPATMEEQLSRLYIHERVSVTLTADTVKTLLVGSSEGQAALIFVATVLVILAIAFVATRYHLGAFIVGMDGRYSNSKTQLALWFLTVIAAYLTAIALRFAAGGWACFDNIGIPENLLVLSGLSALTFGGAKAVTTQKANAVPPNAANPKPALVPAPNHAAPRLAGSSLVRDLFLNDNGQADIGDFQMILITLIAVGTFILTFVHWLSMIDITPHQGWTLPDVDTTLLSLFGLGQGAYLVKKMASNLGEG